MKDPVLPTRLAAYFEDYTRFHATPGNKLCHHVGIPMIALSLLGLLAQVPIVASGTLGGEMLPQMSWLRLDAGLLLWALAWVWYCVLDWRLALPFGLFLLGLYYLGKAVPTPWLWAVFIIGWVFQIVGHAVYEKKSPALLTNLVHIFIGPLWIFARWVGYVRG